MKKMNLWGPAVILALMVYASSCEITDRELGEDLLPPEDSVSLFSDTVFDIRSYMVPGEPFISSEPDLYEASRLGIDLENRVLLAGEMEDTITGFSRGTAVTQFTTNPTFKSGPNLEIDSVVFSLYVRDYVGDMDEPVTFRVHEFTERIYRDSFYYSDYEMAGKFDPDPLAEITVMPENDVTLEILISDQDFRDKFLELEDTAYITNDSIFKDFFNGLYLTADPVSEAGVMARLGLSSTSTHLSVKYASDSTDVDTTAERDFLWAQFPIEELFTQKINIFEHDYSGTYLSGILGQDSASYPYCYVQGIGGVNTRFSFDALEEWMEKTPVAINSARLVFEVVPEEESGILYEDLPQRLMIGTVLEDGTYEPVYDYLVLFNNKASSRFGGFKKAESRGLFFDTVYQYSFQVGLHYQAMIDGAKDQNDFILQVDDGNLNPKKVKLWSNLPGNPGRIRLEIIYLRL